MKRFFSWLLDFWLRNLFLIMGTLFFLGGIFIFIDTYTFINRTVSTTGTVVQCDPGENPDDCVALIRFHTKKEETVEVWSSQVAEGSFQPGTYSVGQKISINYDSVNPHDARIITSGTYIFSGIFIMIGALFLIIEIFLWRPYVKKRAREQERNVERVPDVQKVSQQYKEFRVRKGRKYHSSEPKKRSENEKGARGRKEKRKG